MADQHKEKNNFLASIDEYGLYYRYCESNTTTPLVMSLLTNSASLFLEQIIRKFCPKVIGRLSLQKKFPRMLALNITFLDINFKIWITLNTHT